jgi:hypothetical protein
MVEHPPTMRRRLDDSRVGLEALDSRLEDLDFQSATRGEPCATFLDLIDPAGHL